MNQQVFKEGLEELTKELMNIRQTSSLNDAKHFAEKSLERIATMTIGDEVSQQRLRELFRNS